MRPGPPNPYVRAPVPRPGSIDLGGPHDSTDAIADIDGGKVPGALRKLGITANGGQDHLKGRILRIAHCGYFGAFDILTSLAGLATFQSTGTAAAQGTPGSAQSFDLRWIDELKGLHKQVFDMADADPASEPPPLVRPWHSLQLTGAETVAWK